MKVKCIANQGKDLPEEILDRIHLSTTEFDLKINRIYVVYGIMLWKGVTNYLTLDKFETLPAWFPAELFEVIDNTLPIEWYFEYFGIDHDISFICGYKEIVQDRQHFVDLIDRKSDAIAVFIKRKNEIEEFIF